MMGSRQLFSASYYIAWTLLLLAFAALGARELWIGSHGNFIERRVSASTDAYLKALLGVPDGSERCLNLLSKFYGKHPLVYFCPRRSAEGDFVYDVLSYLSWPKQIRKIDIDDPELQEKLASIDRATTPAFIFFRLRPPTEFTHGWRVGPDLLLAPAESVQ